MQTARNATTCTAALLPSNREMQAFYIMTGRNQFADLDLLDFGSEQDLYGNETVIAQLNLDIPNEVASFGRRPSDKAIEDAKKDGQLRPARNPDKLAENNWEFLDQFLNGTGKDIQEHTKPFDPILQQFIHSPDAAAIREQYSQMGMPAFNDKIGYGSLRAWYETVALPFVDSAKSGFTNLLDDHHWGNVTTQIGGFGNPPKDDLHQWARATATRCDADSEPDPSGKYVQYQVTNLAGQESWGYHGIFGGDLPLGTEGPHRTIVQVFRWTEQLPPRQQ